MRPGHDRSRKAIRPDCWPAESLLHANRCLKCNQRSGRPIAAAAIPALPPTLPADGRIRFPSIASLGSAARRAKHALFNRLICNLRLVLFRLLWCIRVRIAQVVSHHSHQVQTELSLDRLAIFPPRPAPEQLLPPAPEPSRFRVPGSAFRVALRLPTTFRLQRTTRIRAVPSSFTQILFPITCALTRR